jgi:hypothetical protein
MSRTWDPGDLGGHLYRGVAQSRTGRGWSPNTEPTSFTDALGWFVRAAGGNVSAAARLAGVPRRSFRDWLDGKSRPPAQRRSQVARSAQLSERRSRLKPGRERRLRGLDPAGVSITGSYNYDGKKRTVELGRYLDDDAMVAVVDAYLNGADAAGMREALADRINEPTGFYARTFALSPSHDHGWTVTSLTL